MMQRSLPEVLCPGCKVKMSAKMILPAGGKIGRMETVVYRCPRCDLETRRHVVPHIDAQRTPNP